MCKVEEHPRALLYTLDANKLDHLKQNGAPENKPFCPVDPYSPIKTWIWRHHKGSNATAYTKVDVFMFLIHYLVNWDRCHSNWQFSYLFILSPSSMLPLHIKQATNPRQTCFTANSFAPHGGDTPGTTFFPFPPEQLPIPRNRRELVMTQPSLSAQPRSAAFLTPAPGPRLCLCHPDLPAAPHVSGALSSALQSRFPLTPR